MALSEQELLIEQRMHQAFWQQANRLPGLNSHAEPDPTITKAGGEIELFLFDKDGRLATDEQKKQVTDETKTGAELGACAVEIHPDPVNLQEVGFAGWLDQLQKEQDEVVGSARKNGLFVGRSGIIPWVPLHHVLRTAEEKYKIVPAFHDRHRSPLSPMRIGPAALSSAGAVGGINSFQFSVEATSAADSVDKLNRMFMISPFVSALSSNARVIDTRDTGWADTRFEIWRQTHDTRTEEEKASGKTVRVGLPAEYPQTLHQYLEEVSSHPFILDKPDAALDVGIGLSWRDARIKIMKGKYVVEFRPISTQPTLEEDMALAAFTIGRLLWSQQSQEPLLDMHFVRQNKSIAEKFGIKGKFIGLTYMRHSLEATLPQEISRARLGLMMGGIFDETANQGLDLLLDRSLTGQTPDQKLVGLSPRDLMAAVKIA